MRPAARRAPPAGDEPDRVRLHGSHGLGDVDLPPPGRRADPRHAADLLADVVRAAAPGELTLVAVGPLTNLATAVRRAPDVVGRVREVVLMDGRAAAGAPEFNVAADPEAAVEVLDQAWAVTVVGADVTSRATADPSVERRLRALPTASAALAADLVASSRARNRSARGLGDPPVRGGLRGRPGRADGPARLGAGGADRPGPGDDRRRPARRRDPRTRVAVDVDRERYWALVVAVLAEDFGT